MPSNETFHPAHPLPLVSDDDQIVQLETESARGGAASRVLMASVLVTAVAAAAMAFTILSGEDPAAPAADAAASLAANSKLKPETGQATPAIQAAADAPAPVRSTADAQALPPNATDASTREEIAPAEPAVRDQAEKSEQAPDALFRQFQAWAAEQDAQPNYRPLIQEAPAQTKRVAESASAPNRLAQKRRYVRPLNARAEARTERPRTKIRRAPAAQASRPPAQDARTQAPSVQDAQAAFPPLFGTRN